MSEFDLYSTGLHREALRTQQRFPELNYDQAVKLLDSKAKSLQLSYAETCPPLHGCLMPLTTEDIQQASQRGLI